MTNTLKLACPSCRRRGALRQTTTAYVADALCLVAPTVVQLLDFRCGCGMHSRLRCGTCGFTFTADLSAATSKETARAA